MRRTKEAQREINALQKRIDAGSRRETELTALFKRLYEDSALERIPEPREIKIYYREIGLVDDPQQRMVAKDAVAQPQQSQEIA